MIPAMREFMHGDASPGDTILSPIGPMLFTFIGCYPSRVEADQVADSVRVRGVNRVSVHEGIGGGRPRRFSVILANRVQP